MSSPWYPGDVAIGSKVETAPMIFTRTATTQAGIAAQGSKPTIAVLSGAGTAATAAAVSGQVGVDQAGSFILTAGGTSAAPAGGSLCSVTFGTPLSAAPVSVTVAAGNIWTSTGLAVGAVAISKSGFNIAGAAPAGTATYQISYQVIKAPGT